MNSSSRLRAIESWPDKRQPKLRTGCLDFIANSTYSECVILCMLKCICLFNNLENLGNSLYSSLKAELPNGEGEIIEFTQYLPQTLIRRNDSCRRILKL